MNILNRIFNKLFKMDLFGSSSEDNDAIMDIVTKNNQKFIFTNQNGQMSEALHDTKT
jgi:hypothetical protein